MTVVFRLISLLAVLLWSSVEALAGQISQAQCVSYDYSSHFGPTRDQDGHGLCWAFTAAGLLEEELCLSDRKQCGKSLSVLDVSRVHWRLGENKEEGWFFDVALQRLLSPDDHEYKGVCMEDQAPFGAVRGLKCSISDFLFSDGQDCMHDEMAALYRQWKASKQSQCGESDRFVEKLRELLPGQEALGVNLRDSLNSTREKNAFAFLESVLITPACRKSRIQFKQRIDSPVMAHFKGGDDLFKGQEGLKGGYLQEKLKRLVDAFRSKRSAGLSLCAEKIIRGDKANGCGPHGLIANGLRWNSTKQRCEVQLRNSYGKGGDLDGWQDAERVLSYTMDLGYLK